MDCLLQQQRPDLQLIISSDLQPLCAGRAWLPFAPSGVDAHSEFSPPITDAHVVCILS